MKDTKLISKSVSLISTRGGVSVRKLRNDKCLIAADEGDVKIGSYLESGELHLVTSGHLSIGKRLGVVKSGYIQAGKSFTAGSVFSRMADLPEPLWHQRPFGSLLD